LAPKIAGANSNPVPPVFGHCLEFNPMKLRQALTHAARFSVSPVFSLFHTSAQGEYTLLYRVTSADDVHALFLAECMKAETIGLEIRCDGVRVPFDDV
jgi:hypothetical protein